MVSAAASNAVVLWPQTQSYLLMRDEPEYHVSCTCNCSILVSQDSTGLGAYQFFCDIHFHDYRTVISKLPSPTFTKVLRTSQHCQKNCPPSKVRLVVTRA